MLLSVLDIYQVELGLRPHRASRVPPLIILQTLVQRLAVGKLDRLNRLLVGQQLVDDISDLVEGKSAITYVEIAAFIEDCDVHGGALKSITATGTSLPAFGIPDNEEVDVAVTYRPRQFVVAHVIWHIARRLLFPSPAASGKV
jgi:hypothetical protein